MEKINMETFLKPEDILTIITKKINSTNFKLENHNYTETDEKIGMMGTHLFLNTLITHNETKQNIPFFAKLFPQEEYQAEAARNFGIFTKEMKMYQLFEKMPPIISEVIPKCYFSRDNSILVMDNLKSLGYILLNKNDTVSYEACKCIIKSLAKFHASSILYEKQINQSIIEDYKMLKYGFYNKDNKESINYLKAAIKAIYSQIDNYKISNQLASGKDLKCVISNIYSKIFELTQPSIKFTNVICHGDLWSTNFLLKCSENKFTSCKFIDFQLTRYCPPAHDLLSVIYLTTDRELRTNYLEELLKFYYSCLVDLLGDEVITYNEFVESCEEQKLFAVFQAAMYFPIISLRNEDIGKAFNDPYVMFVDKTSLVLGDMNRSDNFKRRMVESIEDIRDLCEEF